MSSAVVRPILSEAAFLRLPESTDKVELIDGEVIASPAPSYWQQEITGRLLLALRRWAERRKRRVTVGHAPLDVRFARNRILQPDLFVLFARVDPAHEGPIDRVPELCIEILSSNRLHDRVTKRLLYGATGVEEYWVVDPAGLIERWTGAGLSEGTEHRTTLRTPLLPGFRLNLRKLFARGR